MRRLVSYFFFPAAIAALLILPTRGRAAVVIDRVTLNAILGGLAVSENFEAFQIAAGGATALNVNTLGVSTLVTFNSVIQGPGLVAPGVTFSGSNLQWNAQNYYAAPSREILFNGPSITLDFATPTSAFGVDVRNFSGYGSTMSVTVFAANGTTVLYTATGLALGGTPIFFGYQNTGGIGRVTFTAAGSSWSPILDNLTFSAIPEPSVTALMLAGLGVITLAWRRRRVPRTRF